MFLAWQDRAGLATVLKLIGSDKLVSHSSCHSLLALIILQSIKTVITVKKTK